MRDILAAITKYREERSWTEYQLAEHSGLPQSTISSWYRKNMVDESGSLSRQRRPGGLGHPLPGNLSECLFRSHQGDRQRGGRGGSGAGCLHHRDGESGQSQGTRKIPVLAEYDRGEQVPGSASQKETGTVF